MECGRIVTIGIFVVKSKRAKKGIPNGCNMKVLMFGWEFPPHISGGLGTACYGLTRGLLQNDVEVIFVVPKTFGDEDAGDIKLISANNIPVPQYSLANEFLSEKFTYY